MKYLKSTNHSVGPHDIYYQTRNEMLLTKQHQGEKRKMVSSIFLLEKIEVVEKEFANTIDM